jgi:hypothetical protein
MDYADIPPGCQYYNPRRQRRHARKLSQHAALRALANQVQREAAPKPQPLTIKDKVKGFVRKLFNRKAV